LVPPSQNNKNSRDETTLKKKDKKRIDPRCQKYKIKKLTKQQKIKTN
jgi:hypothetical protein